jgi:hypothetical protein
MPLAAILSMMILVKNCLRESRRVSRHNNAANMPPEREMISLPSSAPTERIPASNVSRRTTNVIGEMHFQSSMMPLNFHLCIKGEKIVGKRYCCWKLN